MVVGVDELVEAEELAELLEELAGALFVFELLVSVFWQAMDQKTIASRVSSTVNRLVCRPVLVSTKVARCVVTF